MKHVIANVPFVRQELDTCLFAVAGSLLRHRGWDDVMALGASWDFAYPLHGVAREEHYLPIRSGSLMEALLPGQGVTSSWRTTGDPDRAWADLRTAVLAGHPTAVAVDNYHLPFRPAYGDVHSNHLIVVYGLDDDRDLAFVLDATPPRYKGPLAGEHLRNARGSANPGEGDRDLFFARSPIGHAQLEVAFPADPWQPSPATLRDVIERNLRGLHENADDPVWLTGLSGLSRLADIVERSAREHCEDVFVFSGALLARRARHASFLARAAAALKTARLAEVAREVDGIAHQWTAVRILASREARERPETVGARLAARLRRLAAAETAAAHRLKEVLP
jgi:hypothetical protein